MSKLNMKIFVVIVFQRKIRELLSIKMFRQDPTLLWTSYMWIYFNLCIAHPLMDLVYVIGFIDSYSRIEGGASLISSIDGYNRQEGGFSMSNRHEIPQMVGLFLPKLRHLKYLSASMQPKSLVKVVFHSFVFVLIELV